MNEAINFGTSITTETDPVKIKAVMERWNSAHPDNEVQVLGDKIVIGRKNADGTPAEPRIFSKTAPVNQTIRSISELIVILLVAGFG
jgi:hypothetical protein